MIPSDNIFNVLELNGQNGFVFDNGGVGGGSIVGGVGDVNGDDMPDLVMGIPWTVNPCSTRGDAYCLYGSKGPFPAAMNITVLDGRNGFSVHGAGVKPGFGGTIAKIGDINHDGFTDVLIQTNQYEKVSINPKREFVIFGGNGIPASFFTTVLDGKNGFAVDQTLSGLSGGGDYNGDGIDDFIVGNIQAEVNNNPYAGKTTVVYGRKGPYSPQLNLSDLSQDQKFEIFDVNGGMGGYSSNGGDINGDGIDDFIVGTYPGLTTSPANISYYSVFGSKNLGQNMTVADLDGKNGFELTTNFTTNYFFKTGLGGGFDFNGDGCSDFVVCRDVAGVVFGGRSNFPSKISLEKLNGRNGVLYTNPENPLRDCNNAGDVNGDGIDDLLFGAPVGHGISTNDTAYLIFGSTHGFPNTVDLRELDAQSGIKFVAGPNGDLGLGFGGSVSGLGDFNGGGVDDISISSTPGNPFLTENAKASGRIYTIFGEAIKAAWCSVMGESQEEITLNTVQKEALRELVTTGRKVIETGTRMLKPRTSVSLAEEVKKLELKTEDYLSRGKMPACEIDKLWKKLAQSTDEHFRSQFSDLNIDVFSRVWNDAIGGIFNNAIAGNYLNRAAVLQLEIDPIQEKVDRVLGAIHAFGDSSGKGLECQDSQGLLPSEAVNAAIGY